MYAAFSPSGYVWDVRREGERSSECEREGGRACFRAGRFLPLPPSVQSFLPFWSGRSVGWFTSSRSRSSSLCLSLSLYTSSALFMISRLAKCSFDVWGDLGGILYASYNSTFNLGQTMALHLLYSKNQT